MKKILLLVMACTALSVALLGCGGGGGSGTTLDPVTNPTPTPTPAPTPTPTPGPAVNTGTSYSGTFSGAPFHFDKWSMNVTDAGTISGHTNNDLTGGNFSGSIISAGVFHIDQPGGTGGDVTLDGTIDANGNVTGTWVNVSPTKQAAGSFSGTKDIFPSPRFIVKNGTIYDAVSNLTWLQNADCFGAQGWNEADVKSKALASGQCGLTDGSVAGAWRLPSISEMLIIVDDGYLSSSLITTGFSNVQTDLPYWSSSGNLFNVNDAWDVNMSNGFVESLNLGSTIHVWPVRTGQ